MLDLFFVIFYSLLTYLLLHNFRFRLQYLFCIFYRIGRFVFIDVLLSSPAFTTLLHYLMALNEQKINGFHQKRNSNQFNHI